MGDGVEVGILMEQLDLFFDAKGSDEAIDGLPDREASPSTGAVDLGGVFKSRQPLYPQDGIQQEESSRLLKCRILPDRLQDLAENEIRQRQRSPRCDELLQVAILRRPRAVEEIDPDRRIHDDHTRDLRVSSRSPSHWSRPRSLRISFRFS